MRNGKSCTGPSGDYCLKTTGFCQTNNLTLMIYAAEESIMMVQTQVVLSYDFDL